LTPKERAVYIIERYTKSIIYNRKEDLTALIEYHISEAVKEAVTRSKTIQKRKAAALVKARAAKGNK
jgi:hypothetical protein